MYTVAGHIARIPLCCLEKVNLMFVFERIFFCLQIYCPMKRKESQSLSYRRTTINTPPIVTGRHMR